MPGIQFPAGNARFLCILTAGIGSFEVLRLHTESDQPLPVLHIVRLQFYHRLHGVQIRIPGDDAVLPGQLPGIAPQTSRLNRFPDIQGLLQGRNFLLIKLLPFQRPCFRQRLPVCPVILYDSASQGYPRHACQRKHKNCQNNSYLLHIRPPARFCGLTCI